MTIINEIIFIYGRESAIFDGTLMLNTCGKSRITFRKCFKTKYLIQINNNHKARSFNIMFFANRKNTRFGFIPNTIPDKFRFCVGYHECSN